MHTDNSYYPATVHKILFDNIHGHKAIVEIFWLDDNASTPTAYKVPRPKVLRRLEDDEHDFIGDKRGREKLGYDNWRTNIIPAIKAHEEDQGAGATADSGDAGKRAGMRANNSRSGAGSGVRGDGARAGANAAPKWAGPGAGPDANHGIDPNLGLRVDQQANGAPLLTPLDRIRKLIPPPALTGWHDASQFLVTDFSIKVITRRLVPSAPYIPVPVLPLFLQCVMVVLTLIDQTPNGSDEFKILLDFYNAIPNLLLRVSPRMGQYALSDSIKRSCTKFLAGKWKALYQASSKATSKPSKPSIVRNDDESMEQKCKRAQDLAQKGNLSKAVQALTSRGLVATFDPILKLQEKTLQSPFPQWFLHPSVVQEVSSSQEMTEGIITADSLRKIVARKPRLMAPDRFNWRIKEHYGPMVAHDEVCGLLLRLLKRIITGAEKCEDLHTGVGSTIYACDKKDGDVRPVQNVDSLRKLGASMVSDFVLKPENGVDEFFQEGCNAQDRVCKFSQFCFSHDGATQMVKRAQINFERNDAFRNDSGGKLHGLIGLDIRNAFPSINRQVVFDMAANVASTDYKDPDGTILIAKGAAMPSSQIFKFWLPILGAIYGGVTSMTHHFPGRFGEEIDFGNGFSQGCPSGQKCCALGVQFVAHLTALRHPHLKYELFGLSDDCNFLGDLPTIAPAVQTFITYLSHFLKAEVNPRKSVIYIPQPGRDCAPQIQEIIRVAPGLKEAQIAQDGIVVAGVPLGTPEYVNAYLGDKIKGIMEKYSPCLNLTSWSTFYQIVRFSLNAKVNHLCRGVQPKIMAPHAQHFDKAVEQLVAEYLDWELPTNLDPAIIDQQASSPMSLNARNFCALHQFRDPVGDGGNGGMGVTPMEMVTGGAFYAATVKAICYEAQGQYPEKKGPNDSSQYLSEQFDHATSIMTSNGAVQVRTDAEAAQIQGNSLALPHRDALMSSDTRQLTATITSASNQHKLTVFLRAQHPHNKIVRNLLRLNPSDRARVWHLTKREVITHCNTRFDIPEKVPIQHTPMATYARSMQAEALSQYQARHVVKLQLGLPIEHSQPLCRCGASFTPDGAHALCCRQWAGRGWGRGHDVVVDAIANEIKLVGMPVNTDKNFMARHCSHISSGSTGDAYVQTRGELLVTPKVHGQMIGGRSNWIYDVTIDAVLQENGKWNGTFSSNGAFSNACLESSEKEKYCKHEASYANLNFGFLAFAASSFGVMGDDLLRFLYLLASLEVAKINQKQQAMGMPVLTDQRIGLLRSEVPGA